MALLTSSLGLSLALGAFLAGVAPGRVRIQPPGRLRHPALQGRVQQPVLHLGRHAPRRRRRRRFLRLVLGLVAAIIALKACRRRPDGRAARLRLADRAVLTGLALAQVGGVLVRPGRGRPGQRIPARATSSRPSSPAPS
ncbi:MAG: hypothetical protein M0C28_27415 [Candidatus Moduliflexus flocculans]|nr:hypothetical protein [Candidatus Moduliflexus flocculans]